MYPQRSVMTCGLATALEPPHFNHAPVRGAIGASFSRRSRAGSFNPRTRVGCDQCVCVSCLLHAEGHIRDGPVSIHAPAWGATRDYFTTARPWPQFQSTHPRGVRHHDSEDIAVLFEVSIHAPAWGATIIRQSNKRGEGMFQSTHPRGVRRDYRTCS